MANFQLLGTLVREFVTRERSPRVPEPDLVMDNPDKVAAFVRAGREAGIVVPTYLFHCAHISEVVLPGETVVDLACGPATQLGMVARLNPESHFMGIDLSEEMLDMARSHIGELGLPNVELRTGDITDLSSFDDASVDAVFSTLSLHHLPTVDHLASTFAETARILKPDGGLYLTDFVHLKSEKSMEYFAYQHKERQPDLFTIDYLNSLRAAFYLSDFRQLTEKYLTGRARLYSTLPIPLMVVVKSPVRRKVDSSLKHALNEMRQALPDPQQRDMSDLLRLFRLGGLRSELLA